jgi:hypothetical protein
MHTTANSKAREWQNAYERQIAQAQREIEARRRTEIRIVAGALILVFLLAVTAAALFI